MAAFPDARLVFWSPARDGSDVHAFRLKRPCDVHPNGRSTVHLSVAGLRSFDACAAARSERAAHALYPLHAGKTRSPIYRVAVFLSGLVLAALSATGAVTYAARLRGRRPRQRRNGGAGRLVATAATTSAE
jgi:uncharacterized iron-regulated membrane protein